MKILIYALGLPPFRRGGLVEYSVDLSEQLSENGNKVTFLYPGKMPFFDSNKCKFRRKKTRYQFDCFELINPLPVSLTFGNSINTPKFYEYRREKEMRKFISNIAPDVVHIHTIMGLPMQFIKILKEKNIKIVYTTHDYYGLCPKMLTDSPLEKLKSSNCAYDCMMCNIGPSIGKIKIMQSHFYQKYKTSKIFKYLRRRQRENIQPRANAFLFNSKEAEERYKLRKYYLNIFSKVDLFHFNSSVALNVFRQYLPNAKGKVVPLVIDGLRKKKTIKIEKDNVKIGFLGGIDRKKGFFLLKQVLSELKLRGFTFKVLCAGSNVDDDFFKNSYVKNLGIISENDIKKFYEEIDVLIVPSIWHETFGLVVVEAITNNVPVFCSDTVGAKDLIPKEYIFHGSKQLLLKLQHFLSSKDNRKEAFRKFSNLNYDINFKKHVLVISHEFY